MPGRRSPEIRAALRRFRWPIVFVAMLGAIAGVLISGSIPRSYTATTTLAIGSGIDTTTPEAVVRLLEYQHEAHLSETAASIASDEHFIETVADTLGIPASGYTATIDVREGSGVVAIVVHGPSADTSALLADRTVELISERFTAAYSGYIVRVVDRGVERARTLGTPWYILPVVFALSAGLAAYVLAITWHNLRDGRRDRRIDDAPGTAPDRDPGPAARPVFNSPPWSRNLAIAGFVGAATGLMVAGSGAALFTAVAVAVALAVAAAFVRPEWALVGLIALVTLRLAEIASDFYGIPQATIPVVVGVCAVLVIRRLVWKERPSGWVVAAGAVSLVLAASLASVIGASYPSESAGPLLELGKSAIIFLLVVVLITTAKDFKLAIWTLIALGGVIACLSVFQYLTGSFGQSFFGLAQARYMNIAFDYNDFRITGPYGDPNFFAQALVPVFAIALERAWREPRTILRVGAALAAPLILLAIVFTFSRGALVALAVVGVAFVFALRPSLRILSLAGVALALLLLLLPADYVTRATALFEGDQTAELSTDPSVNQRTSILMSGLLMFTDYPVAGVGIGNFPHRYLEYADQVGIEQERTEIEAHSFYVGIAAETGVIGLAAWGVIAFLCFETIRAARRRLAAAGETDLYGMVTAFAIGLLGFFTAALFLHLAYARYLWILLAIVFALPKVVASVQDQRLEVAAASGSAS